MIKTSNQWIKFILYNYSVVTFDIKINTFKRKTKNRRIFLIKLEKLKMLLLILFCDSG